MLVFSCGSASLVILTLAFNIVLAVHYHGKDMGEQVTVGRTSKFIPFFNPDIILVIIGFYVGDEKADVGSLPYNILIVIAAAVMIMSEVLRSPSNTIWRICFVKRGM